MRWLGTLARMGFSFAYAYLIFSAGQLRDAVSHALHAWFCPCSGGEDLDVLA